MNEQGAAKVNMTHTRGDAVVQHIPPVWLSSPSSSFFFFFFPPSPPPLSLPSLFLNYVVGVVVNQWFKEPLGQQLVDPGGFAIVGAAAMWCGSMRLTVTIALVVFEVTGIVRFLPAIAIAVTFARAVGHLLGHSLYHELIHLKGYPFLEDIPDTAFQPDVTVESIMDKPVVTFERRAHVERLKHVFATTTHNGFPIVDVDAHTGARTFVGFALRSSLRPLVQQATRSRTSTVDCSKVMHESPLNVSQKKKKRKKKKKKKKKEEEENNRRERERERERERKREREKKKKAEEKKESRKNRSNRGE